MASEMIRADFEELRAVATRWDVQADSVGNATADLRIRMDELVAGDWQGTAATRFFGEMDSEILPALDRLQAGLRAAAETTRSIARKMQDAEESAAAVLDGRSVGSFGAAATAGGSEAAAGASPLGAAAQNAAGETSAAGAAGGGAVGGGAVSTAGSVDGTADAASSGASAARVSGGDALRYASDVSGARVIAADTAGAGGSFDASSGSMGGGAAPKVTVGLAGVAGLGGLGAMAAGGSKDRDELTVGGSSTPGPSARLGGDVAPISGGASSASEAAGAALPNGRPETSHGASGVRWSESVVSAASAALQTDVRVDVQRALAALVSDAPSMAGMDDALAVLASTSGRPLAELRTELQHVLELRNSALLSGALVVPSPGDIAVRLQERMACAVLLGHSLGVDAHLAALLIPVADVASGTDVSTLLTQSTANAERVADVVAAMRTG